MSYIYVSKDYRVKHDQYSLSLECRSDGKTRDGKHKDNWSISYHPNFEQVANKILREHLKSNMNEDIGPAVEELRKINEDIAKWAKELGEKIEKGGE